VRWPDTVLDPAPPPSSQEGRNQSDGREPTESRRQGWHGPLALGGGGLALLLAGYFLLDAFQPPRPVDEQRYAQWKQLRDTAAADPTQQELAQELDRMAPPSPRQPLRALGVVAFWAGLLLFVAAGIRMYRHGSAAEPSAKLETDDDTQEKNSGPRA
jgi:hypothetical protein